MSFIKKCLKGRFSHRHQKTNKNSKHHKFDGSQDHINLLAVFYIECNSRNLHDIIIDDAIDRIDLNVNIDFLCFVCDRVSCIMYDPINKNYLSFFRCFLKLISLDILFVGLVIDLEFCWICTKRQWILARLAWTYRPYLIFDVYLLLMTIAMIPSKWSARWSRLLSCAHSWKE